jgi:glycine/D-amino acid oxidase-like deaminating enzyme
VSSCPLSLLEKDAVVSTSTKLTWPRYGQACGWQALLPARAARPALHGDAVAELCVVGAGYTGLAAARAWAELRPDDRIAVIDASAVGEGSPGRNPGFLLEIALAGDADAGALARMRRCNALIRGTMDRLRALVADNAIDCQLTRSGTYRAAATELGVAALRDYRRFLESADLPFETLDREELAARTGCAAYRFGLYSPDCSLVQPAALVRGLADCLPESVDLHENTPAIAIRRETPGVWVVECTAGRVRARRVVLANNAFAARLGVGRARLAVIYTYAGLTAPLAGDRAHRLGADREWGLLPAHRLGATLRRTADGRLLVRSHYGYESEEPAMRIATRLRECLARRFPELGFEHQPQLFQHLWGGATGFTYNASPVWGEWREGLYVSAGCNGGGVVKGTLFGDLLARKAAGESVPDVHALFGRAAWMPPEPARKLGFMLRSLIERRRAGGEI